MKRSGIANAVTLGALCLALLFDVLTLPHSTTVGQCVRSVIGGATICGPAPPFFEVFRGANGIRIVRSGTDSEAPRPDEISIDAILIRTNPNLIGFWAATIESRDYSLIHTYPGVLSTVESAAVRTAVADSLDSDQTYSDPNLTSRIRTGVGLVQRIRWSGIAHDAISLLLVCGLCLSVCSMLRRDRELDRMERNLCPHCAYDLRGLSAHTCPECGGATGAPPVQTDAS